MLSKAEIKRLHSLSLKKYRKQYGQFLIEGFRLVQECLNSAYPIESIWMSRSFANSSHGKSMMDELDERGLGWEVTEDIDLSKVTDTRNDQGIVALLPMSLHTTERVLDDHLLILENVSDPGNLGTLLRTADWFGIQSVILSDNSVDPFSPKVVRSAMGAHFYLSVYVKSLPEFLPLLVDSGTILIGGVMDGEPPETLSNLASERWGLLLGNEAHGLSDKTQKLLTHRITIPKRGQVESLNLSVAGGILMSDLTNR